MTASADLQHMLMARNTAAHEIYLCLHATLDVRDVIAYYPPEHRAALEKALREAIERVRVASLGAKFEQEG